MSDVIKDLSELRLTYQKDELHEAEVDTQPHEQFLSWFNYALQAGLHEPYAMSLATANAQGRPHVRTVLLRGATETGYDFYTNYDSQKGLIWQLILMPSCYFTGLYWNGRSVSMGGLRKFQNRSQRSIIISGHMTVRLLPISVSHRVA